MGGRSFAEIFWEIFAGNPCGGVAGALWRLLAVSGGVAVALVKQLALDYSLKLKFQPLFQGR
jgi:hypothetical protein